MENYVNDTDKNLGAISADKVDVITESRRQVHDVITYNKMSWEEAKNLIDKIKLIWKGSCAYQEAKTDSFSIPYFYIKWKTLKIPSVGTPIVAD